MRIVGSASSRPSGVGAVIARTLGVSTTTAADDRPADVALVVVHGMGHQITGETLLEWAEPILGRIDWLAKWAGRSSAATVGDVRADATTGVTIVDSRLTGESTARVIADARWRAPDGTVRQRRIALIEARWSQSFVPMSRGDVFTWGLPFLWRTIIRMFRQFGRTMVLVPFAGFGRAMISRHRAREAHRRPPTPVARVLGFLQALIATVVGALLALGLGIGLVVVGIIVSAILPLLSPLLLIPLVKKWIQQPIDSLVDFVGDVGTFRERPLRSAAMRVVLRDRLAEASTMVDRDSGEVMVLAHSQGAAISAKSLFGEIDLQGSRITRLFTVGAAITLLGTSSWAMSRPTAEYAPVANWARFARDIRWNNYWAIWDPFAAGPIGDSLPQRFRRWRGSYVQNAAAHTPGPEEHAVHNTSLPFTDHQSYAMNTLQVIEPIARVLLGDDFPRVPDEEGSQSVRRFVGIRRARGVMLIAALIVGILVPTFGWFTAAVVWAARLVVDGINAALSFLGVGSRVDLGVIVASEDPARLTTLGTLLAIALLAALLIWISLTVTNWAEDTVLWSRPSATQSRWHYTVELLIQLVYVGGAGVTTVVAATALWPGNAAVPIGLGTAAGVATVMILLAVNAGMIPFVVPQKLPTRVVGHR
ncbi:hypothetical protein [Glaciihabitans sp. dw_435]|uniref:hypothetical protein n=1 Tax=Glaciihabitans sp. dw_435 TaxID=2720081 RepID=UPI001BD273DC|nr:hypothetical protein [Glaciihabitans sp. dw_435]